MGGDREHLPFHGQGGAEETTRFVYPEEWQVLAPCLRAALVPAHPVLVPIEKSLGVTLAHRMAMLIKLAIGESRIMEGLALNFDPHEIAARMTSEFRLLKRGFLAGLLNHSDWVLAQMTALFVLQSCHEAAARSYQKLNLRKDQVDDLTGAFYAKCLPALPDERGKGEGYLARYEPKHSFLAMLIASARPKGFKTDDRHALRLHENSIPRSLEVVPGDEGPSVPPSGGTYDSDTSGAPKDSQSLLATLEEISKIIKPPKHLLSHFERECDGKGARCRQVEDWIARARELVPLFQPAK